jgi:hypothetical protein
MDTRLELRRLVKHPMIMEPAIPGLSMLAKLVDL